METISITTEVKSGKFIRNRKSIEDAVKYFEGIVIEVIFKRKRKESSDPQRKYYWSCIVPLIKLGIKESWGEIYSAEKINDLLKGQFAFKEKVNEGTGEVIRLPVSPTKDMSAFQREEYHEQCRTFAKDWLNVTIPLPGEAIEIEF